MKTIQPATIGNIYMALADHARQYQPELVDNYISLAEMHHSMCNNPRLSLPTSILRRGHSRSVDSAGQISDLHLLVDQCATSEYHRLLWIAYVELSKIYERGFPSNDLGSASQQKSLEHYSEVRRKTLKSATETGARFTWCLVLIRSLFFELQCGRPGKVLESQDLLESAMMPKAPLIRAQFCLALAQAYYALNNMTECLRWGGLAVQYAESACSKKLLLEVTELVSKHAAEASDVTIEQMGFSNDTSDNYECSALLAIKNDRASRNVEGAFHKLLGLVRYHIYCRPHHLKLIPEKVNHWLAEAQSLAEEHADKRAAYASLTLSQIDAQQEIGIVEPDRAMPALRLALDYYLEQQDQNAIASTESLIGHVHMAEWHKHRDITELCDARDNFLRASEIFGSIGRSELVISGQMMLAAIQSDLAKLVSETEANECFVQGLKHLEIAAATLDTKRQDISILPNLQALQNKQCLALRVSHRNIYNKAILICFEARLWGGAWEWIQSSKARSLSDLLGMGSIIPSFLQDQISENRELQELLEEESRLVKCLDSKPAEMRFEDRVRVDTHRKKMKESPVLDQLQALREGRPENLQSLGWLFPAGEDERRHIIVVDFMCLDYGLLTAMIDSSREPRFSFLKISRQTLQNHVVSWLTSRTAPLVERGFLDQLIEPLSSISKPGDLIVLSPSGPLHGLPLHAMAFPDGEPLIKRNPVVYCSNLSILHQCFLRSNIPTDWPSSDIVTSVVMGVYEDFETEKNAAQAALQRYTNMFGGKAIFGDEVTKECFEASTCNAALIHFHGHCTDGGGDILEQALKLSFGKGWAEQGISSSISDSGPQKVLESPPQRSSGDQPTIPNISNLQIEHGNESDDNSELEYEDSEDEEDTNGDPLRVRDIFLLKLHAPVVTLIACGSAHQDVKAGDEPLGLVSAFLYAGAKSVVGTLWDTNVVTGRGFSDLWYEEIHKQMGARGTAQGGLIDLAVATQQAILKIRQHPQTATPYHWAGFVLHGAWMVPSIAPRVHATPVTTSRDDQRLNLRIFLLLTFDKQQNKWCGFEMTKTG